jgi:hypothetical protein
VKTEKALESCLPELNTVFAAYQLINLDLSEPKSCFLLNEGAVQFIKVGCKDGLSQ